MIRRLLRRLFPLPSDLDARIRRWSTDPHPLVDPWPGDQHKEHDMTPAEEIRRAAQTLRDRCQMVAGEVDVDRSLVSDHVLVRLADWLEAEADFGAKLDIDWSAKIPALSLAVARAINGGTQ